MQTKSRNTKLFGMTIFEISVIIGLGVVLCLILGLGIFILYSSTNQKTTIPPPPTFQPTYTPYPTYTPLATSTPLVANTPTVGIVIEPTIALPTAFLSSPSNSLGGGFIRVNSWALEITEIHADPGKDNTRQVIVLLGNLTNEGRGTDTFVASYTIVLKDSQGRLYEDDISAGFAAQSKYQTEYGSMINPGASEFIAIAYDVPVSEKYFLLVPGSLASSWSGDVSFTLP